MCETACENQPCLCEGETLTTEAANQTPAAFFVCVCVCGNGLWVITAKIPHFFVLLQSFAVRWTVGANLDVIMTIKAFKHLQKQTSVQHEALLKAFIDEIHT